jgi:endonuclease/exonuclease/phosphatase family metal-dependent hydrolase
VNSPYTDPALADGQHPGRLKYPPLQRLCDPQLVTCAAGGSQAQQPGRDRHLARDHDIVGLQEADPGSLRSGFTNQTHYLAQRAGFNYWSHQPNRRMGGVASSANGLLSKLEPVEVQDHALPGRIGGRGVLLAKFGDGTDGLAVAVAHLSLGAGSRMSQLGFIAELLSDHPNAVLMGDFNCLAERPEMQVLYQKTRLQPRAASCRPSPAGARTAPSTTSWSAAACRPAPWKPYRPRSPITSPWRCRSTSRPTPCADSPR